MEKNRRLQIAGLFEDLAAALASVPRSTFVQNVLFQLARMSLISSLFLLVIGFDLSLVGFDVGALRLDIGLPFD